MALRRNSDRAAWEARSPRRTLTRVLNRFEPRHNRRRFESELDRDLAAMKRVWQMIRAGAVRMVGEIGRQY